MLGRFVRAEQHKTGSGSMINVLSLTSKSVQVDTILRLKVTCGIAMTILLKRCFRLWNTVPDVTENSRMQDGLEHLNRRRPTA